MKELSLEKLENLEGGKFWGKDCGQKYSIAGSCYQNCTYRVFWVKTRGYTPTPC